MLSAEAARLIDDLEVAHQDVKRAYLAWCPTQAGLVENGVGSDNNGRTSDFLKRERYAVLGQVTRLRNSIIRSSKELDRRQTYELVREVYLVHPSFHEVWWIDKHFEHDHGSVLHNRRFGLDKLMRYIDSKNSSRVYGSVTFLTRYTLLLENLLSSRLTVSLLDVPPDQDALRSNVDEIIDAWGSGTPPTITEFAREMPVLFSVIHTLLEMTDYRALSIDRLLDTNRWLSGWAQCSVNEGPLLTKTSNLSRVELFQGLPSLEDQDAIRNYLRRHYAVSCKDYYHLRSSAPRIDLVVAPLEVDRPRRSRNPVVKGDPRPDIIERIEHWRDDRGLIRYPEKGVTDGGRQYVCFRYGDNKKELHNLIVIRQDTMVGLELKDLAKKPPFDNPDERSRVIDRLNRELGMDLPLDRTDRTVPFPLSILETPGKFAAFMAIVDSVMAEVRKYEWA